MSKFKLKLFHEDKIVAKIKADSLDKFDNVFNELKTKFGEKKKKR